MTRRDFLKRIARMSFVWATAPMMPFLFRSTPGIPTQVLDSELLKQTIRGTRDGRLLKLRDDGETWEQIANFGSHCSIQVLEEKGNRILVHIGVQGYTFTLESTDARQWRTPDQGLFS